MFIVNNYGKLKGLQWTLIFRRHVQCLRVIINALVFWKPLNHRCAVKLVLMAGQQHPSDTN